MIGRFRLDSATTSAAPIIRKLIPIKKRPDCGRFNGRPKFNCRLKNGYLVQQEAKNKTGGDPMDRHPLMSSRLCAGRRPAGIAGRFGRQAFWLTKIVQYCAIGLRTPFTLAKLASASAFLFCIAWAMPMRVLAVSASTPPFDRAAV